MKTKRIICLIISVVLAMSLFITGSIASYASPFKDVTGDEFYARAAQELSMRGILSGYGDGEFKGGNAVTRAELAKLICVMRGEDEVRYANELLEYGYPLPFSDVSSDHWARAYILYSYMNGTIDGYVDSTFRPESPVLYEEAVKMIIYAMGIVPVYTYPDDWARGYIDTAETFGITRDCYCERGWYANRAHIAVMIYNAVMWMSGYDDNHHKEDYREDESYNDDYYEEDYREDESYNDNYYEEEDYGKRGPGEYLLTFENDDGGMIHAKSGYYKSGDKITIKAYANKDFSFMSWSSDGGGEFYNVFKKETTFTMPANDVIIKASYIVDYGNNSDESEDFGNLDRYDGQNIDFSKYVRLTMKMVGCGTYRDLSGSYNPGQVIELRIGEDDADIFAGWSSDDVELPTPNSPRCKITIPDHDVTVTATFING